jgi:hypothetical protein
MIWQRYRPLTDRAGSRAGGRTAVGSATATCGPSDDAPSTGDVPKQHLSAVPICVAGRVAWSSMAGRRPARQVAFHG